MTAWTDELRKKVADEYIAAEPTAETSSEIIKLIASNNEKTSNGVRAVLVKAVDAEGNKIYISSATSTATTTAKKEGSTKISKSDAIEGLRNIIKNNQLTVDEDILGRMTGKAALYFSGIMTELTHEEE